MHVQKSLNTATWGPKKGQEGVRHTPFQKGSHIIWDGQWASPGRDNLVGTSGLSCRCCAKGLCEGAVWAPPSALQWAVYGALLALRAVYRAMSKQLQGPPQGTGRAAYGELEGQGVSQGTGNA